MISVLALADLDAEDVEDVGAENVDRSSYKPSGISVTSIAATKAGMLCTLSLGGTHTLSVAMRKGPVGIKVDDAVSSTDSKAPGSFVRDLACTIHAHT